MIFLTVEIDESTNKMAWKLNEKDSEGRTKDVSSGYVHNAYRTRTEVLAFVTNLLLQRINWGGKTSEEEV